ncbi:hypothetical protein T12_9246 [Trichinella patagoniensis]|uniref:Transmembrane protein n=1 Tax=Trichinella patagoniensis TaxID=990121 RepID=A0A0V0ZY46_9BILA|nr:hypothetical protein T12_9246 [Trichinella patagoniensis]
MVSNLDYILDIQRLLGTVRPKLIWKLTFFLKLALSVASVLLHLIQYPIIDGKLEYFIHCIVMEARTCSTMILLFNINCHYERYDFTFNIHMSDEQERHPLQFHTRTFIVYCIHIVYEISSYTSPSPVKLNRVKMNRNSLGLNIKVVWKTLLCLKTSSDLQRKGDDHRGFRGEEIDFEGRR